MPRAFSGFTGSDPTASWLVCPGSNPPWGRSSGDMTSPSSSVSLPGQCRPFLHVVASRPWALQTQGTTRAPGLRGADSVAFTCVM